MINVNPGVTVATVQAEAPGDLHDVTGDSPFSRLSTLGVTIVPCEVQVDKVITCGANTADANGLTLDNDADNNAGVPLTGKCFGWNVPC